MNRARRVLCFTVTICLLLTCSFATGCSDKVRGRYFSGAAEEYYQELVAAGFPPDYASALTELHLLHPDWSFVPLDISSTNKDYDWDYVIGQETAEADRSMIYGSEKYSAYHEKNDPYRTASSCQASAEAVAYFMDPRNFLNETDIFQFLDLSASSNATLQAVEAVLRGTFMDGAVLENGKTYAQNFYEAGMTLGVYPVYLAVKARQEQGAEGTSPIISGTCGDTLWYFCTSGMTTTESGAAINAPSAGSVSQSALRSLNGYYNIYNVSAYGNGVYEIYKRAMERAKTGSAQMRDAWGGDASWNTLWKSIWGGALFIKESYVDRYQSTPYLQKFNVDGRSGRNFWGQYAQNVADALSQSRILFQTFTELETLDGAYTFLIPVYQNMPLASSIDPAFGKCDYVACATEKYDYAVKFTSPVEGERKSGAIYTSQKVKRGKSLALAGTIWHEYGVDGIEYSIDGGEWHCVSEAESMNFSVPFDYKKGSEHILVIRGVANYDAGNPTKKSNQTFLCAVIYVTVK